jgi:nucleoside-diphosphate-sugar epimerase
MRVLVIGGNGFIGRPVVRELKERGHQVAVLRRSVDAARDGDIVAIQGDRNRLQDCEAPIREFAPQVIIDMVLSSGEQAGAITGLAQTLGARLVAISSMDVYRAWGVLLGTESGDLEPLPITEDSPLRAGNRSYPPELVEVMKGIFTWLTPGYDKVAVEQAVMSNHRNTVIRLPLVYGEGDPLHRMYPVVRRISDERTAILVPEDQAAWRGPRGYVDNVAHAIVLAAVSDGAQGRTYHVCEEPSATDLEWMSRIAESMHWRGRFLVLPRERTPKHLLLAFNLAQHVVADSSRIRTELGYGDVTPVEEAIRRTIAWERENPPSGPTFHQFDYEAEDVAAGYSASTGSAAP